MEMDYLRKASEQAVYNCVKLQKGEKCVVIMDRERKHIGEMIAQVALDISPGNIEYFIM